VIAFDGAGALGDPERGWPLWGFVLGDLHCSDSSGRGPDPEPSDESVDLRRFAAGQNLDAAVGEIAGVPGDPEVAGPSLRAATVEDALHSPAHPADSAYHMGMLLSEAFARDASRFHTPASIPPSNHLAIRRTADGGLRNRASLLAGLNVLKR